MSGAWHRRREWAGLLAALLLALAQAPARAQDAPVTRTALKVCEDPNNLPFANAQQQGIENRIADVFGKALGLPVTYYNYPQRFLFVRNTIKYKLPGQDYPCDIMLGVPAGFDEVATTKPYYRSTYALVFAPARGLEEVRSGEDFLQLDRTVLSHLRIGLYDRSPASAWLAKHGLVDQGVPYAMMNPDPDQYPGEIIEKDLAGGKIDVAVVWGPIAGFFAKRVKSPTLRVVPLRSEAGIRFDYEMAMGVRYGEPEWKKQVQGLIDSHRAEIAAILQDYGVPVVDDSFSRGKP